MNPEFDDRNRKAGLLPEQGSAPLTWQQVLNLMGKFVNTMVGGPCDDPTARRQAATAGRKMCEEMATMLKSFEERQEEKQIEPNDHPRDTPKSSEIKEKSDTTNTTTPASTVSRLSPIPPTHSSIVTPQHPSNEPLPASAPPSLESSIAPETQSSIVTGQPSSHETPSSSRDSAPSDNSLPGDVKLLQASAPASLESAIVPETQSSIVTGQPSSDETPSSSRDSAPTGNSLPEVNKPLPASAPSSLESSIAPETQSSIVTGQPSSDESLPAVAPPSLEPAIAPETQSSIVTGQPSSDEAPSSSRDSAPMGNSFPEVDKPLPAIAPPSIESSIAPETQSSIVTGQPSSDETPSSSRDSAPADNSLPEVDKPPPASAPPSLESSLVPESSIVTGQPSSDEVPSSSHASAPAGQLQWKFTKVPKGSPKMRRRQLSPCGSEDSFPPSNFNKVGQPLEKVDEPKKKRGRPKKSGGEQQLTWPAPRAPRRSAIAAGNKIALLAAQENKAHTTNTPAVFSHSLQPARAAAAAAAACSLVLQPAEKEWLRRLPHVPFSCPTWIQEEKGEKSSRQWEEKEEEDEEMEDEEGEEDEYEESQLPPEVQELLRQLKQQKPTLLLISAGPPMQAEETEAGLGEKMKKDATHMAKTAIMTTPTGRGPSFFAPRRLPAGADEAGPSGPLQTFTAADGWTYVLPEPFIEVERQPMDCGLLKNPMLHILGCKNKSHFQLAINDEADKERIGELLTRIERSWYDFPYVHKKTVRNRFKDASLSCAACSVNNLCIDDAIAHARSAAHHAKLVGSNETVVCGEAIKKWFVDLKKPRPSLA